MILVINIHILAFIGLMQELHIFIEINKTNSLNSVFDLKIISFFEQNWRILNRYSIVNWECSNIIFYHFGIYIMSFIVINRVSHVFWHYFFKSFLIHLVVFKYFYHHIQKSCIVIRVKSNFQNLIILILISK